MVKINFFQKRARIFVFLAVIFMTMTSACSEERKPVTTAEDAVAEAKKAWDLIYQKNSWSPVYSKSSTSRFEPYSAILENAIWIVRGTIPDKYTGEILETNVRQIDGQVFVKVVIVK